MAQCNRQLANDYDDDDGDDDGDDEKLETLIVDTLQIVDYNNCAFIAHYMVWLREIPLL